MQVTTTTEHVHFTLQYTSLWGLRQKPCDDNTSYHNANCVSCSRCLVQRKHQRDACAASTKPTRMLPPNHSRLHQFMGLTT
jgi:hypothetical protein